MNGNFTSKIKKEITDYRTIYDALNDIFCSKSHISCVESGGYTTIGNLIGKYLKPEKPESRREWAARILSSNIDGFLNLKLLELSPVIDVSESLRALRKNIHNEVKELALIGENESIEFIENIEFRIDDILRKHGLYKSNESEFER